MRACVAGGGSFALTSAAGHIICNIRGKKAVEPDQPVLLAVADSCQLPLRELEAAEKEVEQKYEMWGPALQVEVATC